MKHIRPTIEQLISSILADEIMMQYYKREYKLVDPSSSEAVLYNQHYIARGRSANTVRMLIGEPIASYNVIYEGGLNDLYLENPSTIHAFPVIET